MNFRARAPAVARVDAQGLAEEFFDEGFVRVFSGEGERGEGEGGGLDCAWVPSGRKSLRQTKKKGRLRV